ncbi:MAG: DNA polymerase III subunit gamma/tau [Bacteroidales bacterium]|jgi:DNA polymerase-3 subunit gamma/tau|nr:DNA polymerase III subunit gamma/tau [Bacteroidales bacterium]
MENYIVSARKYRPADFHSVVGQEHITTTLQNALKNNQVAQAFLFCGPRGVGKTTCARILAKAINCQHLTEDFEACNECESCRSFNDSASFNIIELDAASHNSVDDIRELVKEVYIPPHEGKYKIYIIDEVHMLTTAAFNAFLKTLEEPPAYAKFILATTEKHKIMPTILSRCQIFDFHRIKNEDIAQHLQYIADKEGVKAEKEALHIIAEKSDGGLRDALSMFDQMVSFTQGNLTYKAAIENLNILDYDYYFKFVDSFLAGDISEVLLMFNEVLQKGFEGNHFINGLANHLRNLLVSKDTNTVGLLEVSDSVKQKYFQQSQRSPNTFILKCLGIANACAMEYRDASNKRLCVELNLLRMASVLNKPAASVNPNAAANIQPATTQSAEKKTEIGTEASPTPVVPKAELKINTAFRSPFSVNPQQTIETDNKKRQDEGLIIKNLVWEDFMPIWEQYVSQMEEQDTNFYFVLKDLEPINNNNNTITITFAHRQQQEEFNHYKMDFIKMVREKTEVQNFNIIDRLDVSETEAKPYQPMDKYNFLAEKAPALHKLRAFFDVEIDY